MSFTTIISEYSSLKSAPLMTRRGSSSCPLVRNASPRATRSGVRARPSRSGSGSMACRSARTCFSRSFTDMRSGCNGSALASQGALGSAPEDALAAQVLEDGARRRRAVERVEVDARRALAEQLGARALARRVEPGRHLIAAARRDALDLRPVGDRHDAGHERHADSGAARTLDEAEVVGVVVEELRDDDIETRVDLELQVPDILLAVAALRVPLGVAATDQAEVVAALAHELDHVDGVAEAAVRRAQAGILRAVAADRDHVLDPALGDEPTVRADLRPARLDRCHVGRALEAERADARHQLDRRLARLGPRARHGDEPGTEGPERLDRAHEGSLTLGGRGREELEGDDRAPVGVELADLHGRLAGRRAGATSCPSSRAPSPSGTSGNRSRWP